MICVLAIVRYHLPFMSIEHAFLKVIDVSSDKAMLACLGIGDLTMELVVLVI